MRLIDADALKARLDFCTTKGMGGTIAFTFKHMVDEQPTITPEPHWIPVTERLPKNWSDILITDGKAVMEAFYYNGRFGGTCVYRGDDDIQMTEVSDVIAWMPLPEPYKGVTE